MEVGLSLGSNLGDRLARLQAAKKEIIGTKGIRLVAQSAVYETEPVAVAPEHGHLLFLNAVLIVESSWPAVKLLARFRVIERRLGRCLRRQVNAPRPIDIDIIYAGRRRLRGASLVVPHPRWAQRRFVVQPLHALRPDLVVPGQARAVAEIMQGLPDKPRVKLFAKKW